MTRQELKNDNLVPQMNERFDKPHQLLVFNRIIPGGPIQYY